MIVINDYNPTWPKEFEALRLSLLEILGSLAMRVDHIGSTSVPGLGAKDIIDIQVTVRALTLEVKQRLVDAGYDWFEAFTQDHVPHGEDEDPTLWAKFTFSQPQGERRTNVHIRINGNPNQRYALLFRDYLRAHPNSVRTVERIKRELVKRHADDEDAYYDIKDPVYDLIWDAAQDWARQTGWNPASAGRQPNTARSRPRCASLHAAEFGRSVATPSSKQISNRLVGKRNRDRRRVSVSQVLPSTRLPTVIAK